MKIIRNGHNYYNIFSQSLLANLTNLVGSSGTLYNIKLSTSLLAGSLLLFRSASTRRRSKLGASLLRGGVSSLKTAEASLRLASASKIITKSLLTLLLILLFYSQSQAQSKKKLQQWIQEGRTYFEQKAFLRAANTFQKVINTGKKGIYEETALYLAGLSYYYAKNYPTAIDYFQTLLDYYPNSGYADWAKYHKGLSMLENPNKKEGGYYVLFSTYENTSDAGLKDRILSATKFYWYKKEKLSFLRAYRHKVRKSFAPLLYEVLAYRLYQEKNFPELRQILAEAKQKKISSPNLMKIEKLLNENKGTSSTSSSDFDTLKISLILPFYVTPNDTAISKRSIPAVEFLAGMELALKEYYPAAPNIKLQVLDSWKDKYKIASYTTKELQQFKPHIIIGELYRSTTETLVSKMNGKNSLIVPPFVNRKYLYTINPNVFLPNPSLYKQGEAVAKYLVENLNKNKILIIYDNKPKNAEYKEGIREKLESYAPKVNYSIYSITEPEFKEQTTNLYLRLKEAIADSVKCFVFVSDSYELSEFFISKLAILDENAQTIVAGHPKWYFRKKLNRVILSERSAIIPGSYEPVNNPMDYNNFSRKYKETYGKSKPSFYSIQGYDIMRVICSNYKKVNEWENLQDIFHKAETFKGIAQNFYWGNSNENQSVILLKYKPVGYDPVYLWKK